MTRKMNRAKNDSGSRKHSSASFFSAFRILYPHFSSIFFYLVCFFAYHESEFIISPIFPRAAQRKCRISKQGRARSHSALLAYLIILVERVDFIIFYISLTFVFVCCLHSVLLRSNFRTRQCTPNVSMI